MPVFKEPQVRPEQVRRLMSDLRGEPKELKVRLAMAELIHLGPSVIPHMLKDMDRWRVGSLELSNAIEVFRKFEKKDVFRKLTGIGGLNNNDPVIRRSAANVLGELGMGEAAPALSARLRDKVFDVRSEATSSLFSLCLQHKLNPKEAGLITGRLLDFLEDELKNKNANPGYAVVRWAASTLGSLRMQNFMSNSQQERAINLVRSIIATAKDLDAQGKLMKISYEGPIPGYYIALEQIRSEPLLHSRPVKSK